MTVVEEVCTITAKGQTTVPRAIRQALGVGYGGRIAFRVDAGIVTVHALPEQDAEDPALTPFLALLEADLVANPGTVQPIAPTLAARLDALGSALEMDPDAPIEGDVSL